MPVWIEKETALAVHQRELRRHGGETGIRDEAGLEGALARPRNVAEYIEDASLAEMAASLAVGIAKAHPFVDGNKRTACVTSLLFLRLNGVEIAASEDELAQVFEEVARSETSEGQLAEWFEQSTVPDE